METHWHYKILASNNLIQGQYLESATIIVFAENESDAIEKAKLVINRKLYIAIEAFECLESHGIQADISMLQLEIQKKLLDLSRGKN